MQKRIYDIPKRMAVNGLLSTVHSRDVLIFFTLVITYVTLLLGNPEKVTGRCKSLVRNQSCLWGEYHTVFKCQDATFVNNMKKNYYLNCLCFACCHRDPAPPFFLFFNLFEKCLPFFSHHSCCGPLFGATQAVKHHDEVAFQWENERGKFCNWNKITLQSKYTLNWLLSEK